MQCFPATERLQRLVIDLLGPRTRTDKEYGVLLMISDHFTKLTNVVTLREVDAYSVAVSFTSNWVYYYGPPESVLLYNGAPVLREDFPERLQDSGYK